MHGAAECSQFDSTPATRYEPFCDDLLLTNCLLSGANADQSVAALTQWLDGQAAALGIGHCLLFDVNGRRVPGLYHRMTTAEESRFRSFLGAKLTQWGAEASVNGMSCGWLVEVAGAGVGKLLMTVHHLGPFHG